MPHRNYKAYSLRSRIFWGFLVICLLSISASVFLSYFILSDNVSEQSRTDQQKKSEALMASLDYAVSHQLLTTEDLPSALRNKIFEISDINKIDLIIYDLQGNYLLSNTDPELVEQKKIPENIVRQALSSKQSVDIQTYDEELKANVISSYMVLTNNTWEPIAIVYFPYYHSDSGYKTIFTKYFQYIILVNVIIIVVAIFISWLISKTISRRLTKFSEIVSRLTIFDKEMRTIPYYGNDEFRSFIDSYNKMVLQIYEQKERLAFIEKENAWQEMAKQVAHEVKNPLTPMKLTIQNFKRKFDPQNPDVVQQVNKMADAMIEQIDLMAAVASAFSQFAQLPEKNNEIFDLNAELRGILTIFNDKNIFIHTNRPEIMINMDKIYLNRIVTNLITNALQATEEVVNQIINVDVEKSQRRLIISVEDNGVGISPEIIDRIFEPNFTSKNSGMGLGLTMVRKMVEDYGGRIIVKSEQGRGTKFTITMPSNL